MKIIDLNTISNHLQQPIEGTEQKQQQLIKNQDIDCQFLFVILSNCQNEEVVQHLITCGIAKYLLKIFSSRDYNLISRVQSLVFFKFSSYSNNINKQLIDMNPYPSLIHLLNHPDNLIVLDATSSIFHLLLTSAVTTQSNSQHPHFEIISALDAIEKLFQLFQKSVQNKKVKDISALCLSLLFRAAKFTNEQMKIEIINCILSLLDSSDNWTKKQANYIFQNLFLNDSMQLVLIESLISVKYKFLINNCFYFLLQNLLLYNCIYLNIIVILGNLYEVLKVVDLKIIANILNQPIEGTLQQQQQIIKLQDIGCNNLNILLSKRFNEKFKLQIITAGIAQSLINILSSRVYNQISKSYSNMFFQLTNSSNEINHQLLKLKPYPALILLLEHQDKDIIKDTISSIYNLLLYGTLTSFPDLQHPHFQIIQEEDGIKKIFGLFQRNDNDKNNKDTSALCICQLYRAQEFTNSSMKSFIIKHINSLLGDADERTRNVAYIFLKGLINKKSIQ